MVDEATGRRHALIAEILGRLSPAAQRAVAQVFREFADAAGEVPDSQWSVAVPVGEDPAPRRRPPVQGQVVSPARGRVNVKEQA